MGCDQEDKSIMADKIFESINYVVDIRNEYIIRYINKHNERCRVVFRKNEQKVVVFGIEYIDEKTKEKLLIAIALKESEMKW